MDYGEKDCEEQVPLVLVILGRSHKVTWAMLVPRKRTEFSWIAKRAAKFIDQLGHNRVTLRCDNEPAIEALAREVAQARQEGRERPPVEKASGRDPVQWVQRACSGTRGQPGQNTEGCAAASYWRRSPTQRTDTVLACGICCVLDEQVRHRQRRKDAAAKTARAKGQHTDPGIRREKI